MSDSGWLAVAGAIAGGSVAGTIALLQARYQHRFDLQKGTDDRHWQEERLAGERAHADARQRRDRLMEAYTRYQLAADRLEDAARELGDAVSQQPEEPVEAGHASPPGEGERAALARHAAAQAEYDEACEALKLLAPAATVDVALAQRRLLNRLVREALAGVYDHEARLPEIVAAAEPVLRAMRTDLGTLDDPP
jgi:hypothetical protein